MDDIDRMIDEDIRRIEAALVMEEHVRHHDQDFCDFCEKSFNQATCPHDHKEPLPLSLQELYNKAFLCRDCGSLGV